MKFIVPWSLALFLAGLLAGGWWGHLGIVEQLHARIAEFRDGKDIAEDALATIAPPKWAAQSAKLKAIRERNERK